MSLGVVVVEDLGDVAVTHVFREVWLFGGELRVRAGLLGEDGAFEVWFGFPDDDGGHGWLPLTWEAAEEVFEELGLVLVRPS